MQNENVKYLDDHNYFLSLEDTEILQYNCLDFDTNAYTLDEISSYIEYLKDWTKSHSSVEFLGMTPVCIDEFLDCE